MFSNKNLSNCLPPVYRIVAYFTNWSIYKDYDPTLSIQPGTITHLNYGSIFDFLAFAKVVEKTNGIEYDIEPTDTWADLEKPISNNKGLYDYFNNPNTLFRRQNKQTKVLISVGGWTGSKYFSRIAKTQQLREQFANNVFNFVLKYGFDGADIDWEFPVEGGEIENYKSHDDKENFTLLLIEIRKLFEKYEQRQLFLTVALSAVPKYLENIQIKKVGQIVDWMNLMTYDFSGPWSETCTHHSNLYHSLEESKNRSQLSIDKAVNHILSKNVLSSKIVVGIGYYGRGFSDIHLNHSHPDRLPENIGENTKYNSLPEGKHEKGVFLYNEIKPILDACGTGQVNLTNNIFWHRIFNTELKTVHLINIDTKTFITFDDPQSIAWKVYYVRSKTLGGIMIWELSGDHNNELTNAILYEFNRK